MNKEKLAARLNELKAKTELSPAEEKELKNLKHLLQKKPNKGRESSKGSKPFGSPGNDFSWWSKEPELLQNSANFKSNYIAGTPVAKFDIPIVLPGVLGIMMRPVYGSSMEVTDPINIWARDLYLRMFQKYRGITSYTAADLGIALIAANEVVRTIACYERIYGVINRYSKLNVNMPVAELSALAVSASDATTLRGRLSDFRYDLNTLIKRAQRLCIPKDMSTIADSISLFGYEYLDHESARSQIIIFNPTHGGVYSDTALSSGGSISFEGWGSGSIFDFSADNMCKFLETQLNALLGSDSIQKIFGDLLVWFGEEAMLQILPLPEEYVVLPVKDDTILHKLHNIESKPDSNFYITPFIHKDLSSADQTVLKNGKEYIYQYNDVIVTAQTISSQTGTITWVQDGDWIQRCSTSGPITNIRAHILDTYRVEADPEVVVEGCLFKYHVVKRVMGSDTIYPITSCAFYIVEYMTLISVLNGIAAPTALVNMVQPSFAIARQNAGQLAVIDWAPIVYYAPDNIIQDAYGDMDNIIPLYSNDLSRLQRTCVLSGLHTDVRVIKQ